MIREISPRATGTFKKGVRFSRIYLASALTLCAIGFVSARDVAWQPQNGSTDISVQNNWNGNTRPGNGDYMVFGNGNLNSDYTVKIPAATAENPYRDYAGLLVNGLNDGQKVTFDATGTSWLLMADPGVTWYGSVAFRVIAGDHIFNLEGLNAANANDNFGFSLTDGKISFKRDEANGSRLVFESGTFNNAFSPDGTATPHKIVFFHSNSAPAGSVVELAGGSATFDQMEIRGKSRDCEVLVSGGEHHVYDGIVLNTGKGGTSMGADSVLHVSGGQLHACDYGQGSRTVSRLERWHRTGQRRKLRMTVEDSATAEIRCGDMANNATAEFALGLKDNATLKIGDNGGNINFGNNSGGKIDFTMTGGSLESYSGGEANVIGFRGGPVSTYTIAGGTITTKSIVIEGVQNDDVVARTGYTNTVRMTGGTVDTLTLGDGHGFDVLKLDAGDTVIVEAANGITANCGAIDVPWKSTEGTHAVFTCKQGVVVGELDKIAVHDGDATKVYAWTTEIDAGTGYTICSVTVAPKGTLTKTITYSSGTVTTNGTGKVSGLIAEESGTQSGELVLSSTASVSVDANQTMTLNGPLVGTGVEITKTGSGKLVLGGGTFLYSGSDPLVFNGALRIAAPSTSARW